MDTADAKREDPSVHVSPHGPSGLGSALAAYGLLRRPYATLARLQREFGDVFAVGPLGPVYLIGPEANRLLMSERPHLFRWREAFDMLAPIAGETALIVSDGVAHQHRRSLLRPAFCPRRVDDYRAQLAAEVGATIERWRPGQIFDVYATLRAMVRRMVIRALFGEELSADAATVGRWLELLLAYVNEHPLGRLGLALPATRSCQVRRASTELDRLIFAAIRRRRARIARGADLLAELLAARDEHGQPLDDTAIRDQIVSLIAAGYDTTSAAVGWTLLELLRAPGLWARIAEELDALGPAARLRGLPGTWLHALVSESLRVHPPVAQGGRRAIEAFEFAGRRIAAGTLVVHSPYLTHRHARCWSEPERFEPRRWLPGSLVPRPADPHAYVPFGAGARRCIGARFASAILHITLAELVARTRLHLLRQPIAATGLAVMVPATGLLVRVDERR